jgi:peptidoglycan biosynthesis protein MviN/MurJ (putative lipid II flippase)
MSQRARLMLQRATGRALVGTLLGNAPGFVLPFAIAAKMHVGSLTDAYAFALGVAAFASALFVGVLQMNALPILQRMKQFGRRAFLNRTATMAVGTTCAVTLFYFGLAVAAFFYLRHNSRWTPQERALLLDCTILFAPFVLASAVNGILSAGLNALNSFLSPAASQALKSLVPLAAVFLISRTAHGLLVIAALLTAGELVRTVMLVSQLRRSAMSIPDIAPSSTYASELPLWRVAAPNGFALLLAAASPLIDRSVAASLSTGSVTLVDLGEKVLQVPLTIISTSLVLVAGTHWASILTTDVPLLRHSFWRTIRRGLVVCTGLLLGMGSMLIALSFVAGASFAGAPTARLVSIVALLLLGLPGAFLIAAGSRFLTATRSSYLLPAFAICSFGTNMGFDIVGAHVLGVQGIALSSTIYRYVNGVLYLLAARRLFATNFSGLQLLSVRRGTRGRRNVAQHSDVPVASNVPVTPQPQQQG